jgi:hypothetical protein
MRTALVAVLWLIHAAVHGQNVSRLYTREELAESAARYREQVTTEYRETILPKLTAAEKAALANVKIEFPTVGPTGDPFEFYSDATTSTIYLPALSLRFYADLCFAQAWLGEHGYDGTTVRDYVGLLFREASASPRAEPPPIFKTLGIPANVRDEQRTADRATRNFANVVVFLLGHELGHVRAKHRADLSDPVKQREQEITADAFAIELFRRLPQIPVGLDYWFDCERIRHIAPKEIPTNAEWQKYLATLSHPVTTERLNALADAIEKAPADFARGQDNPALWTVRTQFLAYYFRSIALLADNAGARVAEYSRIRDLRRAALKPRKAVFALPGVLTGERDANFQGLFGARKTSADGKVAACDLLLFRNGDDITGGYTVGEIVGSIEGRVGDGGLHFTWTEGQASGRGRLETAENGDTLRGTWGQGQKEEGGGTWSATRRKRGEKP